VWQPYQNGSCTCLALCYDLSITRTEFASHRGLARKLHDDVLWLGDLGAIAASERKQHADPDEFHGLALGGEIDHARGGEAGLAAVEAELDVRKPKLVQRQSDLFTVCLVV